MAKLIIIEAFYGGSHKQLLDTILESKNTTIFVQLIDAYSF